MLKESIAVYNPQDYLEQTVQNVYHQHSNRWLTAGELHTFIESVIAYDGLYEQFLLHPENVCQIIFNAKDETGIVYIPCYTLELRQILRRKQIVSPYPIAAFRHYPARALLGEYPLLLAINEKRLNQDDQRSSLDGVVIFGETLNIGNSLVRVMIRERGDSECAQSTDKIVADEYPDASVHMITDVPGIGMSRSASSHKYEINIGSLGIDNEIVRSTSSEDAVEESLTRAWRKLDNPHRDPKYTVNYWKETEYWPIIVKKISQVDVLEFSLPPKKAGTWYEEIREMGEKDETAAWKCGNVIRIKGAAGIDSKHDAIYLNTGVERFKLRRKAEPTNNTDLEHLVGKSICAKGILTALDVFIISDYHINDNNRPESVVYVTRDTMESMTDFEVGDKVRHRERGLAFPQIDGKVMKIRDGLMYVKWEDIEHLEVFKLNDTTNLHRMLEKII